MIKVLCGQYIQHIIIGAETGDDLVDDTPDDNDGEW